MKYMRLFALLTLIFALLTGCGSSETVEDQGDVLLATTYPVYNLLEQITNGESGLVEGVQVELMISEEVSCLHDYTLTTTQMKLVEQSDMVFMSGAGLEEFMASALENVPAENIVDSSWGVELIEEDPHIWLDPVRYCQQAENVTLALMERYPEAAEIIRGNSDSYQALIMDIYEEWCERFGALSTREIITFHDGFAYLADAYDLTILAAIEEEEGAEASAAELNEICKLIKDHGLKSVFGEVNGSTNAVSIVVQETGVTSYTLDMLMSGKLARSRDEFMSGMVTNYLLIEDALE